jgi:hypothetical protein
MFKNDFVFLVDNLHGAESGRPPAIWKKPGEHRYAGYFENEFGDQFVFVFNRRKNIGFLRMGDADWGTRICLKNDRIESDVILGLGEFNWLSACWKAATGRELEKPPTLQEISDSARRRNEQN